MDKFIHGRNGYACKGVVASRSTDPLLQNKRMHSLSRQSANRKIGQGTNAKNASGLESLQVCTAQKGDLSVLRGDNDDFFGLPLSQIRLPKMLRRNFLPLLRKDHIQRNVNCESRCLTYLIGLIYLRLLLLNSSIYCLLLDTVFQFYEIQCVL